MCYQNLVLAAPVPCPDLYLQARDVPMFINNIRSISLKFFCYLLVHVEGTENKYTNACKTSFMCACIHILDMFCFVLSVYQ